MNHEERMGHHCSVSEVRSMRSDLGYSLWKYLKVVRNKETYQAPRKKREMGARCLM